MKKRKSNNKIAAIVLVAISIVLLACIFIYQTNILDNDTSDYSDYDIISDIQISDVSFSEESSENDSSIEQSQTESNPDENSYEPAREIILYLSEQVDLTVVSPYAAAAYTDGNVIFSKNISDKCYPASLTKLLTVSTAANIVNESFMFTVGDELDFVLEDSSTAFLEKGDTLDFLTLVDALLLPSGNDAAYVMAVGVGREYAGDDTLTPSQALSVFLTLMNQTAEELGCTESNFVNPDGYHNDLHYSTASDMLKIAIHAYSLVIVKNSVSQSKARHIYSNQKKDVTWYNTNRLLSADEQYYYEYAEGMKTGTTDEAGYCLIAVAEYNDRQLITVIMGASTDQVRYSDTISLFNTVFG
ncbi:MAG: hypothetical protein PHD46_02140, partial [Eubacteriales bacterium]|nr:hypothetical protein [Eubacteriales bacterium]